MPFRQHASSPPPCLTRVDAARNPLLSFASVRMLACVIHMITRIMLFLLPCTVHTLARPALPPCTRRAVVGSVSSASAFQSRFHGVAHASLDPYRHWAFGVVPPPVERTVQYEELMQKLRDKEIASLQIAVQHDCVIATTKEGHRLTLLLPDDQFPALVGESMDKDSMVLVLPIDARRQAVRDAAQATFATFVGGTVALFLSGRPVVPYGSMAQRERGEGPTASPQWKRLLRLLFANDTREEEDHPPLPLSRNSSNASSSPPPPVP